VLLSAPLMTKHSRRQPVSPSAARRRASERGADLADRRGDAVGRPSVPRPARWRSRSSGAWVIHLRNEVPGEQHATASQAVGMKGTSMSSTLDGRWVIHHRVQAAKPFRQRHGGRAERPESSVVPKKIPTRGSRDRPRTSGGTSKARSLHDEAAAEGIRREQALSWRMVFASRSPCQDTGMTAATRGRTALALHVALSR